MQVDGNDCEAVHAVRRRGRGAGPRGDGPTLIEAMTFRIDGHAVHDGAPYVPDWAARGVAPEGPDRRQLAARLTTALPPRPSIEIRAACVAEVAAAIEAAPPTPRPDPDTLTRGVYATVAP